VQEGSATFTVGEETIGVTGGQIVVAPAGVPHKFVNSGAGPLRQIDIHTNDRFVTEWLEDRRASWLADPVDRPEHPCLVLHLREVSPHGFSTPDTAPV